MSTGVPEIDAIIKTMNKKFGKNFFEQDYGDFQGLTTGSARIDAAIGIGGFPKDHITEVMGWEGSGKTSLCLSVIAQRQKFRRDNGITDQRDLILDVEHSMTKSFIEGFGVDLTEVIWLRPDTAEEALQAAIDIPKSGKIDIVLLDSVDAMQNVRQLTRQIGEVDMGGISKDMNNAMRQICKSAVKTETTYIFINQIKQNPGQMFGN